MNGLIKISKKEAFKLRQMGVSDRRDGISHTWGHHKHYYLCESRQNLMALSQLRK